MLEKFITNIKESLSKKGGSNKKSESENDSDEDSTNKKEAAATSKGSMIIRVLIVLGIAYYAVTEFVLKEEEAPVVAPAPKPRKKPKKPDASLENKEQVAAQNNADTAKNDSMAKETVTTPVATDSQATTTDGQNIAPVENINIAEKPKEETTALAIETPVATETIKEVKVLKLGETKEKEKEIDKQVDDLIAKVDQKDEPVVKKVELKDKIVVEESYVEPPSYEDAGRGLVYNCKDKYWVCVDKPSYVTCNKNSKYNKSHDKKAECVPVNVYNTPEDCGMIQKFYVTTNKSTEFCDGN